MTRSAYYEQMQALAREVRLRYGLSTPRVLRSDLRRIYSAEGIRIDLWPYRLRNLRGAYFNDEQGATVMLDKSLPDEPAIFTLGHELKHHLVDRDAVLSLCDESNTNEMVEIGAEIFAAELIFPQQEYDELLRQLGAAPGNCTPEMVIQLKRQTRTTLSYAGLAKRAEFLGFAGAGAFARIQWKKLEEQLFGEPEYKRIQRYRKMSGAK